MSKPDKPETESEDGGSFLSRWSRRKAEAREAQAAPSVAEPPAVEPMEEEVFDPATLPSIDDLTAESDFSLFLKKGVPPALRAAALRKLWLVEPSVVNYQPLVEYNWDFTAPGYGELLPTDDIAKMAQQVFSGFSQAPKRVETEASAEVPASPEALPAPEEQPLVAQQDVTPAPEPEAQPSEQPLPRRRHGGALPS